MTSNLSLQQKLAQYYRSSGQDDWAKLQEQSNMAVDSQHPVATINYSSSEIGPLEVQFYSSSDGSQLSAKIYGLFNQKIKRKYKETIPETNIIHAGWLYNTSVSSMNMSQKQDFINQLPKMSITKISDNIYVY